MTDFGAATQPQDDGLGFRPAVAGAQATQPKEPPADDRLGFRPAQPITQPTRSPAPMLSKPTPQAGSGDLGFQPAQTSAQNPPAAAISPAPAKPTPPTIGLTPAPSLLDRVRHVVANSAIGHATEEALPRIADTLRLHPTEGVNNPEEAEHAHELLPLGAAVEHPGITKGVAEFLGGFTTPENVELAAATGGLGLLRDAAGDAAASTVNRLVSTGFSAQMVAQAVEEYPAIRDAVKRGDYDTAKQLMTEAGLSLITAHRVLSHAAAEPGATPQERYGATLDRSQAAAPEPVVEGETVPDYLTRVRQRIAERIGETEGQDRAAAERQARINAPVNLPKTPETTAPPPILEKPAPRTPMEELSAQADDVRKQQQFRQDLTREIADGVISRLRNEGLLEEPRTNVTDSRAVRPEDVEPVQPQRKFIGGESVPPTVVPRQDTVARLLENERPPKLSATDAQLGFRPIDTSRTLPPASEADLARIQGEQQRYDDALARARERAKWPTPEPVKAAAPHDITADSKRLANLKIGRFKNPIEQQYARDVWASMIGEGRRPVPPYGMTRERANEIRDGLARISLGDVGGRVPNPQNTYAPDVLDEARAMMEHTHGILSQQQRPGRYFADLGEETPLRGVKVPVTAVTSVRSQIPWFANLKETPADLERALRTGSGANYDRLISSAADYIERSREETQRMARSVEPDLEGLAEQVRTMDPDLADFLTEAAKGNISTWLETWQEKLGKIERRIDDARTAIDFGRAIEGLASEERTAGEAAQGEEETSAGGSPEGARAGEERAPQQREAVNPPREPEGVLPGLESAVREQREAAATEQGRKLSEEANRPPESIEATAGTMERKSPLFRGTEASPQNELFPPRDERGFATLDLMRDVLSGRLPQEAWHKFIAEPIIEKGLRIGDKYADVRKEDPDVAAGLHLLDNAPAYFRAKATGTIDSVVGNLSREQERFFTLMADADSRENLKANHPDEYRRAENDPAIQDALRRYRPIEQELTAARKKLGAETLDQDYLRRVYDEHVSGINRAEAPQSGERAATAFDRVIQPQKIGNLSREATAEYHYEHGLHEFGPAFGTKFIATNLRALENQVARDFISKATELKPGELEPRSIAYNGEKYFRPDVAREMREAGQKGVKAYDVYDPTAGVRYPERGTSRYLGPREVVHALNNHGLDLDTEPSAVRRFLQEQVIGFGFGIPHVANILRRVTQSAPLGAANPEAWARAWKVLFNSELHKRGVSGVDDPTFDKLMQHGAITTGEMANLKSYWGGNLNPANWARTLAGVGHKLLFEPGSTGGIGGVDQRARIYIADLVRARDPKLTDAQIAQAVNTQLGDYNRKNWTQQQKLLSKFMLFPGWDTSSIRWVIEHPIKTTVPPALVVWTANQVLHHFGKNRAADASDFSNIHWGDRSIGLTVLRESMARNLARPLSNYVQAKIRGESEARAESEAAQGVRQGAAGLVGTLRPDLTAALDLATNRADVFSGRDLVTKQDYDTPGRILPNRALEKQATLVVRHAIPSLDRLLGSDQAIDFRAFAGSNLGLPNYQEGAEQRLKRNAAEAIQVSEELRQLAKTNREQARQFVQDPDNAAHALFRRELESMTTTLKRIDDAKEAVDSAKNLSAAEKAERLAPIEKARENLLRNADGIDSLLFQKERENRAKAQPSAKPAVPVLRR